mgnify:CR=1 FL=1
MANKFLNGVKVFGDINVKHGKLNFPNHLLALNGSHHGSGSNGLSGNLLLLLLLAGHESGGRKSEDSDLLHNDYLGFDVVSNDA